MSIEELYLRALFEGMTELLESHNQHDPLNSHDSQFEVLHRSMVNFGWSLIFALDRDYMNKTVWHITKEALGMFAAPEWIYEDFRWMWASPV